VRSSNEWHSLDELGITVHSWQDKGKNEINIEEIKRKAHRFFLEGNQIKN
jgi:hypothetical protein